MRNIIVICTGNTCRSPMAEGIIKKILQDNHIDEVSVSSMGLSAYDGDSASAYSIDALKKIGIDITSHRSRRVMLEDLYNADTIYVMTQQHKDVVVDAVGDDAEQISQKIFVVDVSDPFGHDIRRYEDGRDQMIEYFTKELISTQDK